MKNKPVRHKESNTFKFQSFGQRINDIDIDVFHRVGHKYENDSEETDTFLYQCLQKWNVLNLSESFEAFRRELPCVQTLPLLLNQKEEVVSVLLKYLELKNPLSIQAVLEFVVALVRDLQNEIYAFYPDLLQHLIALLTTKDADQLEWTFTCLAYIFKFLWRYIVKDVEPVFDSILPLLADTEPDYINNFAAESFAFVARKVKDKKSFLAVILYTLKKRPDSIAGCGRLMFEVIRGVSGQFHSCAQNVLSLYLTSLADHSLHPSLLFKLLTHMVTAMCAGIKSCYMKLFWTIACEKVKRLLPEHGRDAESICLLLKLIQQAVAYKDALLLVEPAPVVQFLMDLLVWEGLSESILTVVSEIGASILLSHSTLLPQEYASQMTLKIVAVPHTDVLLSFAQSIMRYSGFEVHVLPHLLHYFSISLLSDETDAHIDRKALHCLTQLILYKAPPSLSGVELKRWQQYPLELTFFCDRRMTRQANKNKCLQAVLKFLTFTSLDAILEQMEDILCVLLCLPHLKYLEKDEIIQNLGNMINMFCEALKQYYASHGEIIAEYDSGESEIKSLNDTSLRIENQKIENVLFLLSVTLETLIHLVDTLTLREVCKCEVMLKTLLPYANIPRYFSALRAIDLYLTAYNVNDDGEEFCTILHAVLLYAHLTGNLSSPFHKVRLLTAHIFSLLEENPQDNAEVREISFFGLCLAAESVAPSVHEYREKLKYMKRLEYDASHSNAVKFPKYRKVPLQYMFGVLYVNFQLLWEPTIKAIATYAKGLPIDEFWELFVEQLTLAVKQVKGGRNVTPALNNMRCCCLRDMHTSIHEMNDRPDYVNYRILLWNALAEFPEICEIKNRDVTPIFHAFVEEEFFKTDGELANSCNIKKKSVCPEDMEVDEDNEDETSMEVNELEDLKEARVDESFPLNKKLSKTLLAHMNVFAKLRTPKTLYREPELIELYHELLTHKNPEVQKLALDCLMTYKHKALVPYKDHLYGLLDDKSFRTVTIQFSIHKENTEIQEEHRTDLVNVIMRILFGKMLTKAGTRTSRKEFAHTRRALVLQYLSGCHENEMMMFIEMAFRKYGKFISDDNIAEMVKNVMDSINLENMIPPKCMSSSINLFGVIMKKFGSLMGHQIQPYLLRVLLGIGATTIGALLQKELVYPGFLSGLKSLRSSCIRTMATFFDHFNDFLWSNTDVDAVFRVFVWPNLEKLPEEGIYSPTALLKLFVTWSQHPRYFVLLVKHADDDQSKTPLPYIMKLLLKKNTNTSVCNIIMEMVERLLTLQDPPTPQENIEKGNLEESRPLLEISPILPINHAAISELSLPEKLNYGSSVLLPHVPSILEYLKCKMCSSKSQELGQHYLVILSRVSELVSDSTMCDTLIELLLPILYKKAGAPEEVVFHLITTLANLMVRVHNPDKYLRFLAPLFGGIAATAARKLLCNILERIGEQSSDDRKEVLAASAQLIGEINAWDVRWVEQPDFSRRLDGFKQVHEMLKENQIELELGVIIIHNCFFLLKSEKDMSLRDSAGYCLRKLTPALCHKYRVDAKNREFLLNDTVLKLVRTCMTDKNEVVQHEAISLLAEMARECADLHPVLRDLSRLTNKVDLEVDFFENLLHLQSHRKARALLRFCEVAKDLEKPPNPRTLTQFILPLTSSFLCCEKYSNKNSIVDGAISAINMACRLLPWHQYEAVLRFYLHKLQHVVDFQKQLVRIIVAILNAFHFDLSRAQIPTSERMEESKESEPHMNQKTVANAKASIKNNSKDDDKEIEPPLERNGIMEEDLKKLDHILGSEQAMEIVEEGNGDQSVLPAASRQFVLSHSEAVRVINTIATILLPQLQHTITQRTQADSRHKLNRKHMDPEQDEKDVLRVPVALAAVKLLQQLPPHILNQNLPGIFMKLCTFLKSRWESVRRVTRETLQEIMATLGPSYLYVLLHEMITLLTRGFHVHVLVYTIHSVVVSLKDHLKPGDIDICLPQILEVCKMDIFGAVSEEKNVAKIAGKLIEARSTKSFDTLNITAQYVTEKCFIDMLLPLKEILASTSSFKIVQKATECLHRIGWGLASNNFVSVESLLIFIYGMASESIPELLLGKVQTDASRKRTARQPPERPDSFLIPKAPRSRSGEITAKPCTSLRTNAHVLVEFGLQLYVSLLKKEKLNTEVLRPFNDPLVSVLLDCLKSQHVKLTTLSLRCLVWVLKLELPSLKTNIEDIATAIFSLLHKYAGAVLSKGDNFDLVAAAFKTVTVLVRDVKYHTINTDQLKALLFYVEQDMHDCSRQASAFSLLKAVLARKLVIPEVHDVMSKIATLSITSDLQHIRFQARHVFHQFIMDYPLGEQLEKHVTFYISQLNYELKPGRESALEMIYSLIQSFPLGTLSKYSGTFFLTLAARLVNDEDPQCRKMVAHCIKNILLRLKKSDFDILYNVVVLWFKDKRIVHRCLAAQLCGIFVSVEREPFESRLAGLLPIVIQQFNGVYGGDSQPGQFVRLRQSKDSGTEHLTNEEKECQRDHHLFQVLNLLKKLCDCCSLMLKNCEWQHYVETIGENAEFLLAHPHEWVRLTAAQLLGFIFGSLDVHEVASVAQRPQTNKRGYLMENTKGKLKSLVLDLCAQLRPGVVGEELIQQVLKNLVFLGRVFRAMEEESEIRHIENEADDHLKVTFSWMIRRMRKVYIIEMTTCPTSVTVRSAVFKWIAAMVMEMNRDELLKFLASLMAPLVQVITSEDDTIAPLHNLAKDVLKLTKGKIDMEEYSSCLSKLTAKYSVLRAERKKQRAQEVITEPEKAAKRKIKKQLKKKDAKKRKLDLLKGRKRKIKRVEIDKI